MQRRGESLCLYRHLSPSSSGFGSRSARPVKRPVDQFFVGVEIRSACASRKISKCSKASRIYPGCKDPLGLSLSTALERIRRTKKTRERLNKLIRKKGKNLPWGTNYPFPPFEISYSLTNFAPLVSLASVLVLKSNYNQKKNQVKCKVFSAPLLLQSYAINHLNVKKLSYNGYHTRYF